LGTSFTDTYGINLRGLCFSRLGVLGKLCSESKLSPQRLAVGHRAICNGPFINPAENGFLLIADTLGTSCTDLTNKKTATSDEFITATLPTRFVFAQKTLENPERAVRISWWSIS